ncbi:hypothetical protein GETHLI_22200 [Geothrix limicola]|uniref:SHOCT domain-containing protein n=1 Tax=Geothrix limicola TaxID=2927978 RepID=A0ABQ5QGB5_9BACT|nr:SHOCT domain-containing protein [Geothrix limicola]GLH73718.1 hypothetical protein GETHLI_22200 [Geothrix limicola]
MRPQTWMLGTLLLSTLAAPQAIAESRRTQWKLADFTWVKLVPAEPGAPANAHPATLSAEALVATLGPVQATLDEAPTALFAKDELKPLSKALSEALAAARPGEDLILLSTHKRGGGFLEMGQGLTARLFVREGALNLIVHDVRLPFMDRFAADATLPTFVYGSRTAAAPGTSLQAPGATRLRGDWLALPLPQALPPATSQAAAPGPVATAPTPTPAAKAEPQPTRDAAFYAAQTERLKALKKLREENLISEAEYQEKREAILKTL